MDVPEPGGRVRLLVGFEEACVDSLFESRGLVTVFILSGEGDGVEDQDAVARWLGLTECESRVAGCIARGERPADIAAALGISLHTVRQHLKNIYRKTGTHSQSQLTAVVLNLLPWV